MDVRSASAGGLGLGVAVVVWQLVSAGTGLLALFVPVATVLQVGVLIATLWKTRKAQGYGSQLATGTTVSAMASAMAFVGCVLLLPLSYPGLFESLGTSPLAQGIGGVVGTMVTGIVVSALAAIGLRRR